MNDTTKATAKEEEGPRRSGRERRPASSFYADAKLAEKKKREAMNDKKKSERSIRYVASHHFLSLYSFGDAINCTSPSSVTHAIISN